MFTAHRQLTAPMADRRAHSVQHHGDHYDDPYFWLRDPGYPEVKRQDVLDYLTAENDYFAAVMQESDGLTESLFEEIKGRLKEDEQSVPWREGTYDYRWSFDKGAQYRDWFRRPAGSDAEWTLILSEPQLAENTEFFKLASVAISPDGTKLAYSIDTTGGERFTLYVKDLESNTLLDIEIRETSGEIVWHGDGQSLYVVHVSAEWRPYQVIRKALDETQTAVIYEEKDIGFFVHIGQSVDDSQLLIRTADHETAEYWTAPLTALGTPTVFDARVAGHDYTLDHDHEGWLILSNKTEQNFTLYRGEAGALTPVLDGSASRYIISFMAFQAFLAVHVRDDGQDQILIKGKGAWQRISFPEDVFEAGFGHNPEYRQHHIRLTYSSMVTPATVYDYHVVDKNLETRKVQEIPSGYDANTYVTKRLTVTARDGADIPVSFVAHKDWVKGAGAKLHLYGYGAYGLGMSPTFSPARLSLLNRGFAYAIAHIRGGDEKGRAWYEAGKQEARENSFNDFVDVARALVDQGFVTPGRMTISGGSAGGELMGAVLNQAKELFGGAVLHVPFVDVLNTMLDASLPLTPIEWPEWGNPLEDADAYALLKGYCPYTNLTAGAYPAIMVTGGLNDPRVTYWEPAKYVAKLRTLKQDDTPLIMKINMAAGHGGKSGRYDRYREVAEEYAFLLMAVV